MVHVTGSSGQFI